MNQTVETDCKAHIYNRQLFAVFSSLILTFCSLMIMFAIIGITPFGDRSFLVSDMYSQYSAFFSHFRRTFVEGGSLVWSSEMSLGSGTFGLWAYYLFSPLNFLTLLFPAKSISSAITLIIMLKLLLSAATASVYFHNRNVNFGLTLAFSMAWAMSGYATIFAINIMWLDGMIFLPLILLGIEKIVEKKRDFLYIFSLAAAIITNYYIGYMICIFCCMWFAFHLAQDESPIPEKWKKICHFSTSSLLAGGLSGVVILPVAFSLRGGKSEPPNLKSYIPVIILILSAVVAIIAFYCHFSYKNSSNFLSVTSFVIGIASVAINLIMLVKLEFQFNYELISMVFVGSEHGSDLPNGPPMIYCGVGALMLAIASFYKNNMPIRRKISYCILLGSLLISTMVSKLNLIWHAFNSPTWFLYRYSFLIIFVLLVIASEAKNQRGSWIFSGLIMSIFAMISLSDPTRFSLLFAAMNIALIAVYTLFLHSNKYVIIILCMIVENVFSTYVNIDRLTNIWTTDANASRLENFISGTSEVIDSIRSSDSDFYRIENRNSRTLNDSMLIGYNGISHYSSAFSTKTIDYIKSLGFSWSNAWVNYSGGTSEAADSLLGIRYILEENSESGSFDFRKNESALGVAIFALGDLPSSLAGDPFEQLEASYEALCGQKMEIFEEIPTNVVETSMNSMTLSFELDSDETLYLWLEIPFFQDANYSLNGSEPSPCLDMTTHKLMQLDCRSGTNLIKISSSGELFITSFKLCRENHSQLMYAKELLKSAEISINGSQIKIKNPEKIDGTLFVSIPFDSAFRVKADGKDVAAREVFGGLTAVETGGAAEITMQYVLPGFRCGLAITCLSISGIILKICFEKRKSIISSR